MPFATTWMDLEGTMPGEMSQAETHMLSLMCGI